MAENGFKPHKVAQTRERGRAGSWYAAQHSASESRLTRHDIGISYNLCSDSAGASTD